MIMRYIPHTSKDVEAMLKVIGVTSVEDLFTPIPKEFRLKKPLNLPSSLSEIELKTHVESIANKNTAHQYQSFLGAGCYRHFVPTIVNYLGSQGGFLTAYTPYQPEISQGTLQALFEFQTMIASLLGMEVANASQYDGASSLAEALLMALRVRKRKKILISEGIHPEYLQVVKTYLGNMDVEWVGLPVNEQGRVDRYRLEKLIDKHTAAVCVQSPNFFGVVEDQPALIGITHQQQALYISCFTESLAFGLLQPAGPMGADIVCGEGMSLGNYLNLGGPHLGLFTTRQEFVRQMPGRLVGETVDAQGKRGFVLTLSTREQHIRREKATSNICTNSGLCALAFTIHLSLLGERGLRELAELNHSKARELRDALAKVAGVEILTPRFFNEFAIRLRGDAAATVEALLAVGIVAGVPFSRLAPEAGMDDVLLVAATETTTTKDIQAFAAALARRAGQ